MAEDEGGESVCWLDRVCPDCGLLVEDVALPAACPKCGAMVPSDAQENRR